MKITQQRSLTNHEHSHLLLDSSLLVVGEICEAISYVTSPREKVTSAGKPYVSFILLDKHGGFIEASMFGFQKSVDTSSYVKDFTDKVVYIKGEVVRVHGELRINLISIDIWTESVFTKKDFIKSMPNLDKEIVRFNGFLNNIEQRSPDLGVTVDAIRRFNLVKILANTTYDNVNGSRLGDVLHLINSVLGELETIETSTEDDRNYYDLAMVVTILHLGFKHYVKLSADKAGTLVENKFTNQIILTNSLINQHKIFGSHPKSESYVFELVHLNECEMGMAKPVTFISKAIPKMIELKWSLLLYRYYQEESIKGNKYVYNGEEFIKII